MPAKNPSKPKTATTTKKDAARVPIPVSRLTLRDDLHLNGVHGRGYASTQDFIAGDDISIEYRPWMRHHVLRFKGRPTPIVVHETWAVFEADL